jgi:hypothetical protein
MLFLPTPLTTNFFTHFIPCVLCVCACVEEAYSQRQWVLYSIPGVFDAHKQFE